jgi:hypothetical protein
LMLALVCSGMVAAAVLRSGMDCKTPSRQGIETHVQL